MNLDPLVIQLRAYCPLLGGRIGGAADFDNGVEKVIQITDPATGTFIYPAAIVYPLEDDATPNTIPDGLMQGLEQIVTETIGVIVEFDATADRFGFGGVDQVEAMKFAIFAALLNFRVPDVNGDLRTVKGLEYAGGNLLTFDRKRLFWEFRFAQRILVTDADGFPASGYPLTDAAGTIPVGTGVPIQIDVNTTDPPQPLPNYPLEC